VSDTDSPARGVLSRRSWRGPCTARWPGRRSRRHAGGGGRRTIFVAGGRALDSLEGRRHDRAHEQLVDPALGLDGGGEFLERVTWSKLRRGLHGLSGRSPGRGSKMVSVVTRPRSGPTNSTSPARRNGISTPTAPRSWKHSHGRDRAVLVACLPAASRRSSDAPDDAAPSGAAGDVR
jgi:hypothetical protein